MEREWRNQEQVASLLEQAEFQGYLTVDDILEAFPKSAKRTADFRRVLTILRSAGVEVCGGELIPIQPPHRKRAAASKESDLARISIDDTVGLYLKEMSRVPLLSHTEEVSIARRIEAGRDAVVRLKAMRKSQDQSPAAERKRARLEALAADGRAAREHLIKANTRLVVSVAKRYMSRGVHFLDLIQEGNLGLMKAVEKFDYHRGFRFSTYATWWIRQTISRAIADQSRTIRVPVHMTDRIQRLYRTAHDIEQRTGRKPTSEEIGDALGIDERKVDWMLQVSWRPVSLENPVGDEDEEMITFVEDTLSPSPTESVERAAAAGEGGRSPFHAPAARSPGPAHAFRAVRRAAVHARGSRPEIRADAGTHPPDRRSGVETVASPAARAPVAGVRAITPLGPPIF